MLPRGVRDIIEDWRIFDYVISTAKEKARLYNFQEIYTPALELFETLSKKGGEEIEQEIYVFPDKKGRKLALRFDHTVPLARIVSSRRDLQLPFKRFAVGPVWRYDEPQKNRYREFFQADVDIVGCDSLRAEAEVVAWACDVLETLGLEFKIKVSSRKFYEDYLGETGVSKDVLRVVDKWYKIGEENVKKDLERLGAEELYEIIKSNRISGEAKDEFQEFYGYVKELGFKKYVFLDLAIVRGLDYYDGLVFEIYSNLNVSIGGGGRYNKLMNIFKRSNLSAVGISLGVDRIVDVMKDLNMGPESVRPILVCDIEGRGISLVSELRRQNIPCDWNITQKSVKKFLEYANKIGARFVIIIGPEELEKGVVALKDLEESVQKELTFEELISHLKQYYS